MSAAKLNNNKANANACVSGSFVLQPAAPFIRVNRARFPLVYNRRLRACQPRHTKPTCGSTVTPKAKKTHKVKLEMAPQRTRITLPSTLPRPTPRSIDPRVLRDACPEVKDVAPSFLRQQISLAAPHMLAGLESTHILSLPSSQLPTELQVVFGDAVSIPNVAPTHILALTSTLPNQLASVTPKYTLYPIHQLPFVAHCSSFPSLPSSPTATAEGNSAPTAMLPLVRMSVPSVETFPLFQTYVYVKDAEALRATFLPPGWSVSASTIIERAMTIKGVWANAVAFGMVDGSMYDVIEDCWAEVLGALQHVSSPNSS